MASPVTAVGRLLRPLHGEPCIRRVIAVRPDGQVRTVVNRPARPVPET
jgi:hypothetical protein